MIINSKVIAEHSPAFITTLISRSPSGKLSAGMSEKYGGRQVPWGLCGSRGPENDYEEVHIETAGGEGEEAVDCPPTDVKRGINCQLEA